MRFKTLDKWLAWQETLHPKAIDLGLERVRVVAERMELTRPAPVVITVAGTNGKGSCVAILDAILRAAGYRCGAYTSPHLLRYNERVVVDGEPIEDVALCAAFERVDQTRGNVSLSYFEFGTLAAFDLMERAQLDVALLEVGLGGRLDAVNIVDADCALITSIGLDHTEWLGPDRDSIAKEKAGIMREGKPAVCGERNPPTSLFAEVERVGSNLKLLSRDFDYADDGEQWTYAHCVGASPGARPSIPKPSATKTVLPKPALLGHYQLANAACCIQALDCLSGALEVSESAIAKGLSQAKLPGRMQRLEINGTEVILDVAHNPQAATALASALEKLPERSPQVAVFAQLREKDHQGVAAALKDCFSSWHIVSLQGERGYGAESLDTDVKRALPDARTSTFTDVSAALAAAIGAAGTRGRVVVFGSFVLVETVLRHFEPAN